MFFLRKLFRLSPKNKPISSEQATTTAMTNEHLKIDIGTDATEQSAIDASQSEVTASALNDPLKHHGIQRDSSDALHHNQSGLTQKTIELPENSPKRITAPLSEHTVEPNATADHHYNLDATKGIIDESDIITQPSDEYIEQGIEEDNTRQLSAQHTPSLSTRRSSQCLSVAALRDIGRVRKVNQDSVFTILTSLPRENTDIPMGLFVVADGMGGHEGGEIASQLATRTVVHHILTQLVLPALDDNITEALQPLIVSALQEANTTIWHQAQQLHSDMGTTCTAVLLLGQSLYIAHVGDTRAYLLEAGGMRQLTTDHSAVGRLIQLGQLDPSEAPEHPLRNQLYRTIGQQPQVQVDFIYQRVDTASHILLCSDGLWGMVDEHMLHQALQNHLWPQDACHELIALANLAGGDDNISAVVVTLPITERL